MKINGLANTAKTVPEKEDMPFSSHDATRPDTHTLREKSARMLINELRYTLLQRQAHGWAGRDGRRAARVCEAVDVHRGMTLFYSNSRKEDS